MAINITPPNRNNVIIDSVGLAVLRVSRFFEDIANAIKDSAENLQYDSTDFTITGTAGFTLVRGVATPYQKSSNGSWYLKFSIDFTCNNTTDPDIEISGVTFKTGVSQAICVYSGSDDWSKGIATGGGTEITITAGTASTAFSVSGDVELDSKPTWAN